MKLITLFLLIIKLSFSNLEEAEFDYCTFLTDPPKTPNDCVFFSTDKTKCCFAKKKDSTTKDEATCVIKKDGDTTVYSTFICEQDYFYQYTDHDYLSSQKIEEFRKIKGQCSFIYNGTEGYFKYDSGSSTDDTTEKKFVIDITTNGMNLYCLNSGIVSASLTLLLITILIQI